MSYLSSTEVGCNKKGKINAKNNTIQDTNKIIKSSPVGFLDVATALSSINVKNCRQKNNVDSYLTVGTCRGYKLSRC